MATRRAKERGVYYTCITRRRHRRRHPRRARRAFCNGVQCLAGAPRNKKYACREHGGRPQNAGARNRHGQWGWCACFQHIRHPYATRRSTVRTMDWRARSSDAPMSCPSLVGWTGLINNLVLRKVANFPSQILSAWMGGAKAPTSTVCAAKLRDLPASLNFDPSTLRRRALPRICAY